MFSFRLWLCNVELCTAGFIRDVEVVRESGTSRCAALFHGKVHRACNGDNSDCCCLT